MPLLVTAHRANDIVTALRLAKEFDIRIVLDGAAESVPRRSTEIKAAGVPVIVHPTMSRAGGDAENLSMETAAKLREAGIPVALQSGYESYVPKTRVVLFEAAVAAANGLTFDAGAGDDHDRRGEDRSASTSASARSRSARTATSRCTTATRSSTRRTASASSSTAPWCSETAQ